MRRLSVPALVVLCALIPPASGGATTLGCDDFQYCTDLGGAFKTNSLYTIHLSRAIVEKSRARFADLRLLSDRGTEIPYVIIDEDHRGEPVKTYTLGITDYASRQESATITAKLPKDHRPISSIVLKTDDRDFHKKAVLSGSSDGKSWRILAERAIYDFSSQVDLRNTKIPFKPSRYRYYRLKLVDVQSGGDHQQAIKLKYEGLDFSVNEVRKKALRIQRMEGVTGRSETKGAVYDRKVFLDVPVELDKAGNSVIILKAGVPMDRISFTLSNPYFSRAVRLRYSDTGEDDSYRPLNRSTIYRFTLAGRKEAKNVIEARSSKHRYYKIVIANKSNPPLDLQGLTLSWVRKNLYFVALNDGAAYSLCLGNTVLSRPDYELKRFITRDNLSRHTAQPVQTGPVTANAGYVPAPSGEGKARMEKLILTVIIIILVLGMGFWLYRLVRKMAHENDSRGKRDG